VFRPISRSRDEEEKQLESQLENSSPNKEPLRVAIWDK